MPTEKFTIPISKHEKEDHLPKYRSMDSSWVLFHPKQKLQLDAIAHEIMSYRKTSRDFAEVRERITANMIIRCLVKEFLKSYTKVKMETMFREEDVEVWVWKMFKG